MPRLRRRPGDERIKQSVGRDAPNRPDDVTRLQRALSETGDYTFTAPRERSGVMSADLETALTRYQRRTGLKPDGYVAPDGPTVQQIAAEADAQMTTVINKRVDGSGTAVSDRPPQASSQVDNSHGKSGKKEDDPSQRTACRNATVSHQNAQGQVKNARDQLHREQTDLENVKRAMEEIRAGQAQTLTDAILEELIRRILFFFGLAEKIVYIIREGIKYIDTKQTMSNLRHYRRTLESAVEEWENKVNIHEEEVEKARERMLTHCGRDVLPEEPDKIGRRPGATTAEA